MDAMLLTASQGYRARSFLSHLHPVCWSSPAVTPL